MRLIRRVTGNLDRIQLLSLGNSCRGWSQRSDPRRYVISEALPNTFDLLTHFYAQMTSSQRFTHHFTCKSPIENGNSSHKPSSNAPPPYGKMLSPSPSLARLHPILRRLVHFHLGTLDSSPQPLLRLVANPNTDVTPAKPAFCPLHRRMEVRRKAMRRPSCYGSASA